MSNEERLGVEIECEKFIIRDPKFNQNFLVCSKTNRDWILNYFSLGKDIIPYEMIERYNSLDIALEKDVFFFASYFLLQFERFDNQQGRLQGL